MKVALIGMPAAGKTSQGKKLAQDLDYTFVDLDKFIEAKENMSIQEIFNKKGENYFREVERVYLHQVLKQDKIVLSTGGGTPCFFDNMNLLRKNCLCVFVNASLENIEQRILRNKTARPMFLNVPQKDLKETLENLYQSRIEYYWQAHFNLEND
jgi:shikimate kinase